jgi:hypothetical protein
MPLSTIAQATALTPTYEAKIHSAFPEKKVSTFFCVNKNFKAAVKARSESLEPQFSAKKY